MELAALQEIYPDIIAEGAALVAVSPQLRKYSQQVAKNNNLAFPVLADPGNDLASRFGLTHTLPAALRELYAGFGIDLVRFNGNSAWTLPMPGRFIIDPKGIIANAEAHPDYTKRPDPEKIPRLLQSLS